MQQIFSRIVQTVRANWNHWTTQNQDPEVLLEQAIQVLQDESFGMYFCGLSICRLPRLQRGEAPRCP